MPTPVFVFPRIFAAFDLQEEPEGELVIVNETDNGFATFERVAQGLGSTGTVAGETNRIGFLQPSRNAARSVCAFAARMSPPTCVVKWTTNALQQDYDFGIRRAAVAVAALIVFLASGQAAYARMILIARSVRRREIFRGLIRS